VAALLRLRVESRHGRWEAVLALAAECLRELDALRVPPGESAEERLARLRALYGRYYPPIHLGKGFNTDINRAYREDLAGSGWDGLIRLLSAHCREAQARAHLALGRPAEALSLCAAIPDGAFVSLDLRALKARAAEAAGDPSCARREWQAAFAESPLNTPVWDKLAEAWMRAGDRPAFIAFLEDILILARAFLSADQAERVRVRLDQERAG
jgi:tetratricopeptide (TPR) repeat protein